MAPIRLLFWNYGYCGPAICALARNPVAPGSDDEQWKSVFCWLLPIHEAGHGNKQKISAQDSHKSNPPGPNGEEDDQSVF